MERITNFMLNLAEKLRVFFAGVFAWVREAVGKMRLPDKIAGLLGKFRKKPAAGKEAPWPEPAFFGGGRDDFDDPTLSMNSVLPPDEPSPEPEGYDPFFESERIWPEPETEPEPAQSEPPEPPSEPEPEPETEDEFIPVIVFDASRRAYPRQSEHYIGATTNRSDVRAKPNRPDVGAKPNRPQEASPDTPPPAIRPADRPRPVIPPFDFDDDDLDDEESAVIEYEPEYGFEESGGYTPVIYQERPEDMRIPVGIIEYETGRLPFEGLPPIMPAQTPPTPESVAAVYDTIIEGQSGPTYYGGGRLHVEVSAVSVSKRVKIRVRRS
ncbi:MAG: hypothetical protein FWE86_00035 [Oscillospiraceae bacterium]|nr:hypothetical protein [Oscillospiraceae bacterium]